MEMKERLNTQREDSANTLFINAVGSFGCWQKRVFTIVFLANTIQQWPNFAMTFLAPNTPYTCIQWSHNGSTISYANDSNQCCREILLTKENGEMYTEKSTCIKWKYNETDETESFISKFDLVCEREWLISFSKTIYMAGFMASVFIGGLLCDRLGRRIVIIGGYILGCFCLILSLFANSMTTFLILRFLHSFGETGSSAAGIVLIIEIVGPKHRTAVGILIQLAWSVGALSFALIGFYIRNCFWLQLTMVIPITALLLCYGMIPESPRWLMVHHKTDELQKLTEIAAKKNGLETPDSEVSKRIVNAVLRESLKETTGNLLDVFKNRRMKRRIFNVMYCWLVNNFIYYGLSYNTNDFAGDPYINFAISAMLEIPSFIVSFYAAKTFGRRLSLAVFRLSCCIPTGILIWLQEPASATAGLALLSKLCISFSYGLMYLYTGELFPTVVRTSTTGVCSTVARIGSMTAPFVRDLDRVTNSSVSFLLYSMLSLTSGILVFWLPETVGRNLPDTFEEGEDLDSENSCETEEQQSISKIKRKLCCKC